MNCYKDEASYYCCCFDKQVKLMIYQPETNSKKQEVFKFTDYNEETFPNNRDTNLNVFQLYRQNVENKPLPDETSQSLAGSLVVE